MMFYHSKIQENILAETKIILSLVVNVHLKGFFSKKETELQLLASTINIERQVAYIVDRK